jgi:hypothetical protein
VLLVCSLRSLVVVVVVVLWTSSESYFEFYHLGWVLVLLLSQKLSSLLVIPLFK